MYSDWTSVQNDIQTDTGHQSVLARYPVGVGRDVANSVVHSLAQSLTRSIGGAETGERSSLHNDADVKWTMQVRECTDQYIMNCIMNYIYTKMLSKPPLLFYY